MFINAKAVKQEAVKLAIENQTGKTRISKEAVLYIDSEVQRIIRYVVENQQQSGKTILPPVNQ